MVINLRNYGLGVFQVVLCTMRCVHGSINKILWEWDPGPTYDVGRHQVPFPMCTLEALQKYCSTGSLLLTFC